MLNVSNFMTLTLKFNIKPHSGQTIYILIYPNDIMQLLSHAMYTNIYIYIYIC